jgi:hypothetical protein
VAVASIIFEGSDFNALEILSSASVASVCSAGLIAKVATAGGNCWVLEVHSKEASLRDLGTYPPYGCHFFAGTAAAESILKDCAENEEGSAETDEHGVAETAPSFLGSAKKEEAAVGVGVSVRVAGVVV